MSSLAKCVAGLALIAGLLATVPDTAEAGYRRHCHRGWVGGWSFGFGFGYPYYARPYSYGPYYIPYYYAPPPTCGWVRYRVWRRGHWVLRRAWRCW